MWFTNPMKMFTQEKRKLYIHKDWYAIFMPWLLAAKIQKKHECPSVGVMVGAVKSKITWEAGAIFIVWVNVGRPARRNGWHHSLTGILCSLSEKESWAAVCVHLSLLSDCGGHVPVGPAAPISCCLDFLTRVDSTRALWAWLNRLPSVSFVRVFSQSRENETRTAGQGINKFR